MDISWLLRGCFKLLLSQGTWKEDRHFPLGLTHPEPCYGHSHSHDNTSCLLGVLAQLFAHISSLLPWPQEVEGEEALRDPLAKGQLPTHGLQEYGEHPWEPGRMEKWV